MPTPRKGRRLGGSPAHQKLILANLATALFEHGRITTTETRARVLRPVAEKLITKAKRGDLHNRREVLKTIHDKTVVHRLFTEIAETYKDRPGGYTRITKIGPRKGDNAPMAVIELVQESYTPAAPRKSAATSTPAEEPAGEAGAASGTGADTGSDTGAAEDLPAGAHAPLEDAGQAPEGFPVKGNRDSMKYHEPDGQWYEQTVAEIWFDSAESAEAAGYEKAGS